MAKLALQSRASSTTTFGGTFFSLAFLFNNFKKKSCVNLRNLWLFFIILFSLNCSREKYIEKAEEISLSKELTVFVISTLPVVELRGALPVGINYLKLRWERALVIALLGNLLPVMPLLLLWGFLYRVLGKVPIFRKILDYIFSKTRSRSEIVRKYEIIGLIAFVAIPFPGTGAWTGTIAAFLLGLDRLKSFIAICIGVLIAGIVVTSLCLLGIWGAVIALIALLILGITGTLKLWK